MRHVTSYAYFIDESGWEIVKNTAKPGDILIHDSKRIAAAHVLPRNGFHVIPYTDQNSVASLINEFQKHKVQLGIVASFSRILPPQLFMAPKHGTVNIHFAKLPEYRGANTLQWAIINGEKNIEVTLHYIDAGIDSGPIIQSIEIPVHNADDAVTVRNKGIKVAQKLLAEFFPRLIKGTVPAIPQDHNRARHWPRRKPEDGQINWDMSDKAIYNLIRALVPPWPGAYYFDTQGRKITIDRLLTLEEIRNLRRSMRLK